MREKIPFDDGWLFHRGDVPAADYRVKGPMYVGAKTERVHFGPAGRFYVAEPDDYSQTHELNPEKWEKVTLPHDYVILQKPTAMQKASANLRHYKAENLNILTE